MLYLTERSKQKFVEFAKNVLLNDIIAESFLSVIEQWKFDHPNARVFFIEKQYTTCQCAIPYLFEIYDWHDKSSLSTANDPIEHSA